MIDNIYSNSGLPIRRTIELVPSIFRTDTNSKFFAGTFDPLIQPGSLDKLVGYVGKRYGKTFTGTDVYLDNDTTLRSRYQLEPGVVIKNNNTVESFYDYIDFKNQLSFFNNTTDRDDKITAQDHYSWNPPIDWDKFINYQEYYWVPNGPPPIEIKGQSQSIVSTYKVRLGNESSYVFFPDGHTHNPTITLYRGQTYKFNVNVPDNGFVIKTAYDVGAMLYNPTLSYKFGQHTVYDNKLWKAKKDIPFTEGSTISIESNDWEYISNADINTIFDYTHGITNSGTDNGTIIFKVPMDAPDVLFYQSINDPNRFGRFVIGDVESYTKIDVLSEIIGKSNYTSSNDITLSNGMLIYFTGQVLPVEYSTGKWIVDGVGSSIQLINMADLIPPFVNVEQTEVLFDDSGFDSNPFSDASLYPLSKDYIVINKSSNDSNPWSRYNRWFHRSVLEQSHQLNNTHFTAQDTSRAKRPIIEFNANIKLFNNGTRAKTPVDFIDTVTADVFSTIEGSQGYYVDGELLFSGARVLFTADTDILANNKIYEVTFINHSAGSTFRNNWDVFSSYRSGDTIRFQGQSLTALFDIPSTTVNVVSTNDLQNTVRLLKNTKIEVDMAVQFTGSLFSNVNADTTYYVISVDNTLPTETNFSISLTKRGTPVNLVNDTASDHTMYATFSVHPTNTTKWKTTADRSQISLKLVDDSESTTDDCVLVKKGVQNKGKMYHFNGVSWIKSQEKTKVNQSPLFDVFDNNDISFGNTNYYPLSTFTGTKIVSFKIGNSVIDPELGFSLSYLNIDNIGDIAFNFDWDIDNFTYENNKKIVSASISSGYLLQYLPHEYKNCWIKSNTTFYQGIIDSIIVTEPTNTVIFNTLKWNKVADSQIYKILYFVDGKQYTNQVTRVNNVFTFSETLSADTSISIKVFCDTIPDQGYYEIPVGLERNPLNQQITTFTVGEVTDHVMSAIDLNTEFNGKFPGTSNLRDITGYQQFAKRFLKHAGCAPLAITLLCDKEINIVKSLQYSAKAYRDYKHKFIQLSTILEYNDDPIQFVDDIIISMTKVKQSSDAFADSDMLGVGAFKSTKYTVEDTGITVFSLSEKFDLTTQSRRAVYVYKNNIQLVVNRDYVFNSTFGFVEITTSLLENDEIEIREYSGTAFSFMPPSPTKLGLYKRYIPTKFLDDTYIEPINVIQGHDGSITVAYNDFRDDILLELERRIYNNIKQTYTTEIFDIDLIIGSKFYNGVFSRNEITSVLTREFRKWLQETGTTFTENEYFEISNPFTYVYSNVSDISGTNNLPGWWRGLYKFYYDTDRPHQCPWEMLGFSEQPIWWESTYGPAPYTSNNLILWEDLANGIIKHGSNAGEYARHKRSTLLSHIPVDEDGKLLDPIASNLIGAFPLIGSLNDLAIFKFGDGSPVETAWKRSSDYPFALMIALSILRPFEFLIENFDKNKIVSNKIGQTVSVDTNKFVTLSDITLPVVGGYISSGLINYITNYLTHVGISPTKLQTKINNIDVNLSTRMSGFVEKSQHQYILDSKNPRSKSSSIFVPHENFDIIFNVSVPIRTATYSGIIVEKTNRGYKIYGYDNLDPIFKYWKAYTSPSIAVSVGGTTETYVDWEPYIPYANGTLVKYLDNFYRAIKSHSGVNLFDLSQWKKLPGLPSINESTILHRTVFDKSEELILDYGHIFTDIQDLVDFIYGYESYLIDQGFDFSEFDIAVNEVRNWTLSVKELLFWNRSNWAPGSLISLSPLANKITLNSPVGVMENLLDTFYDYSILQHNGNVLPSTSINVNRQFQKVSVETINRADSMYLFKAQLVLKEHVTIFSDKTVFNDVIYEKTTGYRQDRLKSRGFRTTDWDGDYTSPGFLFDNVSIQLWKPFAEYHLGDIVSYKSYNWTSLVSQTAVQEFDFSKWSKLDTTPEKQLVANFDFKVNQFDDYYNVDADGTSSSQRALARHAIGYQEREYLQDLSEDQVTQFNLYQGFIKEKGTANAIIKVFDKLKKSTNASVVLKEEWAFKVGNIGGIDQRNYIEFEINKGDFKLNPQPIIVSTNTSANQDLYIRVNSTDFTFSPIPFTTNVNPLIRYKGISRSAGYVRDNQVDYILKSSADMYNLDVNTIKDNTHFWFTFESYSWSVSRFNILTSIYITNIKVASDYITITTNKPHKFKIDSYIGIREIANLSKFWKVEKITDYTFSVKNTTYITGIYFDESSVAYNLCMFTPSRHTSFDYVNQQSAAIIKPGSKLWIDKSVDNDNRWQVVEKQATYTGKEINSYRISNHRGVGQAVAYIPSRNQMIFSATADNAVLIANKSSTDINVSNMLIPAELYLNLLNNSFGSVLAVSPDDMWLAIGAPFASGIPTRYAGPFNPSSTYSIGDIVKYNGFLWTALSQYVGDGSSIDLSTEGWELTQTVIGTSTGYPSPYKTGAVFLYKYRNNQWESDLVLMSPNIANTELFGSSISLSVNNGEYYLSVSAPGSLNDQGRVYNFVYKNNNWMLVQNASYKGIFDITQQYNAGSIVWYDNHLWKAINDTLPGVEISLDVWEITTNVSGTLPSRVAYNDSSLLDLGILDDSSYLHNNDNTQFAEVIKAGDKFGHAIVASRDGSILVISAPNADSESFLQYRGLWNSYTTYKTNDVVKYVNTLSNSISYNKLYDPRSAAEIAMSDRPYLSINQHPESLPWVTVGDSSKLPSGKVYIYAKDNNNSYRLTQTIAGSTLSEINDSTDSSAILSGDQFGFAIDMDLSGLTLVVSSPTSDIEFKSQGSAYIFRRPSLSTTEFRLVQKLQSFEDQPNEFFGTSLSINLRGESIAVGAKNAKFTLKSYFDNGNTTFDNLTTTISDNRGNPGQVYVYEKHDNTYFLTEKLDADLQDFESFGSSVDLVNSDLVVGSPFFRKTISTSALVLNLTYIITHIGNTNWNEVGVPITTEPYVGLQFTATGISDGSGTVVSAMGNGKVRLFSKLPSAQSWTTIASEPDLVNLDKIRSVSIYNTDTNINMGNLDIVDNFRLKILGKAEQEISYKTLYDPAVYTNSADSDESEKDVDRAWFETNVGNLWWDLSTAKFFNSEQGDIVYKLGHTNNQVVGSSIDIYEWVESTTPPVQWKSAADTAHGLTTGISGVPISDTLYSVKTLYNAITGEATGNKYYFWVKNKNTVPANVPGRVLSSSAVALLISSPQSSNIPFVSVIGPDMFALYNVGTLLTTDNAVINVEYINDSYIDTPIHSEYQLLTEGDETSTPTSALEDKWIDSLVGYDIAGNIVPDISLPKKQRYGISVRPRQSMFVDRYEVLSAAIDRINTVLSTQPFATTIDYTYLNLIEYPPIFELSKYDVSVSTNEDLQNVGTIRVEPAILSPVILDNKIISITIVNSGFGYKTVPTITITGTGTGATATAVIDTQGRITSVSITNSGKNYISASVTVRSFSVLVESDSTLNGDWAIYNWDNIQKKFIKSKIQGYNTPRYWSLVDWYATGVYATSRIVTEVDNFYKILNTDISIGDIIKISEYANGGWALLQKTANGLGDISTDYKLVGREAGTIIINKELLITPSTVGFDTNSTFDGGLYDLQPTNELRNIFNAVKHNIFIDSYKVEWNKLFFSSIRYSFVQMPVVDWAFKTSFLNATHNVGSLEQKLNYRNDNLSAFQDYIEEVKPYRTTIREYKSAYNKIENGQFVMTDFDNPPYYSINDGKIIPADTTVRDLNPWKLFNDNLGYSITNINVSKSGSGYTTPPTVLITGNGSGASATAYLSNGKVSGIVVTNQGAGYTITPTIKLVGGNSSSSDIAIASAVLGNGLCRTMTSKIKFDRITKSGQLTNTTQTDMFTGTGYTSVFDLTFAPSTIKSAVTVYINNQFIFSNEYNIIFNKIENRLTAKIQFNSTPLNADNILITYTKHISFFDAVNRINQFYSPTSGMLGKDLPQLMTGIDFGGVQIQGTTFDITGGWDATPWFTDNWDGVDPAQDYYYIADGSTTNVELPFTPVAGQRISIYLKKDDITYRLDNESYPAYGTMPTFVGDGITNTIEFSEPDTTPYIQSENKNFIVLEVNTAIEFLVGETGNGIFSDQYITIGAGDTLIFRPFESDGAIVIDNENILDTELSGGTFDSINGAYITATGKTAEEISINGGAFIQPEHVPAPEEQVPGQVLESVSIKVYMSSNQGATPLQNTVVVSNGNEVNFDIGISVLEKESIIVYVDKDKVNFGTASNEYTIDFTSRSVIFNSPPALGSIIGILAIGIGGSNLLDYQDFISDGDTDLYLTSAEFSRTSSVLVLVNGVIVNSVFGNSADYISVADKTIVKLSSPPPNTANVKIVCFGNSTSIASELIRVNKQTVIYDGSTHTYELNDFVNLTEASAVSSVIVELNNTVLTGVDTIEWKFTGDNNSTEVCVDPYASAGLVSLNNISVFINGIKVPEIVSYTFNNSTKIVTVNTDFLKLDDTIKVVTDVFSEYNIVDNSIVLTELITPLLAENDVITVTWFKDYSTANVVNDEYTGGQLQYKLKRQLIDTSYAWIFLNGKKLHAGIDFSIDIFRSIVTLNVSTNISDKIKIMEFGSNIWSLPSSYEIFKDMLNTYHYKRFAVTKVTLENELFYTDQQIVVTDGSTLFSPNAKINLAGVVIINNERIEYLQKSGNVLSQLRRGSMGTSIAELHLKGSSVINSGPTETIPYSDNQETYNFISDGSSLIVGPLPFIPVMSNRTNWYRTSIPMEFNACDSIEVFVGGKRLRKDPMAVYVESNGSISPSADVLLEAEFSVDGSTPTIRLTNSVKDGIKITIVRRTGKLWSVGQAAPQLIPTSINDFILQKTTSMPN